MEGGFADLFAYSTVRLYSRQRHSRHPEPRRRARRQAVRRPPPSPRLSVSFATCWLAFSGKTRQSHDTQKDTATGYGNTWAWLYGVYLGGHENTGIDPRRIERSVAHTRCRRFPRVIPGMTLDCQSSSPLRPWCVWKLGPCCCRSSLSVISCDSTAKCHRTCKVRFEMD